jgi:small subunit ribosomal protein S2
MTTETKKTTKPASTNKKVLVNKEKLLEARVHVGEQKRFKNPKMAPFIAFDNHGKSIIDLGKTMASLDIAYDKVNKLAQRGGKFLFVGTDRQSSEAVKLAAERTGNFYINHR